ENLVERLDAPEDHLHSPRVLRDSWTASARRLRWLRCARVPASQRCEPTRALLDRQGAEGHLCARQIQSRRQPSRDATVRLPASPRSTRQSPRPSLTFHARPENSPVPVFTQTFSPVRMYSGTWISIPVSSFAGLVRLVALAPFSSGAVSTTVSDTLDGISSATGASSISCT